MQVYDHTAANILAVFVILSTFFIDWCLSVPLEISKVSFRWPKAMVPFNEAKNSDNCIWFEIFHIKSVYAPSIHATGYIFNGEFIYIYLFYIYFIFYKRGYQPVKKLKMAANIFCLKSFTLSQVMHMKQGLQGLDFEIDVFSVSAHTWHHSMEKKVLHIYILCLNEGISQKRR